MKILAWVLSIFTFIICVPFASLLCVIVFKAFYNGFGIYNIVTYIMAVLCGFAVAFEAAKSLFNTINKKEP